MCTVILPPCDNPIAVNKYIISYQKNLLHLTKYHDIWYLSIFRKTVQNIQVSLKSVKNNGYFTWRPINILIMSNLVLLRMITVSDKVVEEIKTHILCSITFFLKSCILWDNVKNICRAGQAKDDNTAHAHFMLDNNGDTFALTICNTNTFSTATMVARTRLKFTFYIHCLSLFSTVFDLPVKDYTGTSGTHDQYKI